jgi:suppressor of ftsI
MHHKKLIIAITVVIAILGLGWATYHKSIKLASVSVVTPINNGEVFNLEAEAVTKDIDGTNQNMLAYNGSIPGPSIKVRQGSNISVKFTNKLSQDTAVHFHGVRTDNAFDGVVGVTQKAVKTGQSYTYKLSFPDPGTYWYHPHLREDATQPLGLYGSIIVAPKQPNYWSPVNKEVPLMIGDILMDKGKVAAFSQKQANYTLMGRFGNTMLVNGSTTYNIFAKAGEVDRLYFTNVASVRPLNITIPGARLKLVGGDNGKYEHETYVDSVTLGPSERAVVDVLYQKPGTYRVLNQTPDKRYELATVTVSGDQPKTSYATQFNMLKTNSDTIASIDPFRASFTKPVDRSLKLSVSMASKSMNGMNMSSSDMSSMNKPAMNMPVGTDKIEWEDSMPAMNKASTPKTLTWQLIDQATGLKNEQVNWQFKRGQPVKIKIYNDPNSAHPMQHPIHIHGQRFLVTSVNGDVSTNLAWKDTVQINKGDTVELLIDMSNPGNWIIHCHIPEHMESGMLLKYSVV